MNSIQKRLENLEAASGAKTVILVHYAGDEACFQPGKSAEPFPVVEAEARFPGVEITWLEVRYTEFEYGQSLELLGDALGELAPKEKE